MCLIEEMGNIYVIANGDGKSGKSTTALNLAICFATLTQKTLLIDLSRNSWVSQLCDPKNLGQVKLNTFLSFQKTGQVDLMTLKSYDKIVVDCPSHLNTDVFNTLKTVAKVIIPVECEYYGLNTLPDLLRQIDRAGIEIAGFLPVMHKRGTEVSETILNKLTENFDQMVFLPSIQRNYYLAHQKDLNSFVLSELSNKAAVTYLSLANTLL